MREIEYTTNEQIEAMREELEKTSMSKKTFTPASTRKTLRKIRKTKKINKYKLWFKRVISSILSLVILLLVAILVFVFVAKAKGQTPDLFGYQLYIIESGSMEPTFKVGNIILTKKVKDATTFEVDDVVTFKTLNGSIVTHRIVEIVLDEDGNIRYKTKGDNKINSIDIELLEPDRIIADFVIKIPFFERSNR